jgi:membrane-associated phospholipid phosphatase
MYEDRSSRKWSISYFTVNFLLRNNKYTCIHLSIRYITNHNCNPTVTASALQEARLSFPSGHSSYSTYAFVFLFVSVSILGVSGFPGS